MRHWLVAKTRDLAVANDLLAETFAYAWRNARRFRGDGEDSGAAWLFGIARNLELHHHRRGRVESSARARLAMPGLGRTGEMGEEVLSRIDAEGLSPSIRAAFAELTPDQREAIGYRVLGELSYAEVAEQMQSSTVTARTRVHRGLTVLREAIERGAQT
jgi:RNA polymerase sigma-70 factor (ECF subfamily)